MSEQRAGPTLDRIVDSSWPDDATIGVELEGHELAAVIQTLQTTGGELESRLYISSVDEALWRDIDPARLKRAGVVEVGLGQSVEITSARAGLAIDFIRFLRDAVAASLPVRWSMAEVDEDLLPRLTHLFPPSNAPASWITDFGFGRFFWRNGPSFITVRDLRSSQDPTQYILDDPDLVAIFRGAEQSLDVASLKPSNAALRELIDEGLVLELGGRALTLPYRLLTWPIPCMALRG